MAHASSVLCGVLVMIAVAIRARQLQYMPQMFRLGSVERFARNSASFVCSIHPRGDSHADGARQTIRSHRYRDDAPSPTPSYSMRSCARTFRPDTQRRRPQATTAPATRPPLSVKVLTHRVHYWLLRARALRTSVHPLWVLSRPSVAQGDTSVLHQQKTRHHTKQREKYQFLQSRRYSRRTADVQFLNPPLRLAPISARSRGIAALTDLQSVQHQRLY